MISFFFAITSKRFAGNKHFFNFFPRKILDQPIIRKKSIRICDKKFFFIKKWLKPTAVQQKRLKKYKNKWRKNIPSFSDQLLLFSA